MADAKRVPYSIVDPAPALFNPGEIWVPGSGANPARYLVNPGKVTGPNKHSSGNLRHARPYIVSGNVIFVFPIGMEGFTRNGTAQVALHHFIGANAVKAQTISREEGRITLTGTFPGGTAQDAMVACVNILRSKPNAPGLVLYAPGVFDMEQYVTAETWEFTHDREDRSHSIDYTISLIRTGEGDAVKDPHGKPAISQPTTVRRASSSPSKTFTARAGIQTLRAISKAVYGTVYDWEKLVRLNQDKIGSFNNSSAIFRNNNVIANLQTWQLPTYRWPIGTKFRY